MKYQYVEYEQGDVDHYIDYLSLPCDDKAMFTDRFHQLTLDYDAAREELKCRYSRNVLISTIFTASVLWLQFIDVLPGWIPGWYFAIFFHDADTGLIPRLSSTVRGFLTEMGLPTPQERYLTGTEKIFVFTFLILICSLFMSCATIVNIGFGLMALVMYPVACMDYYGYVGKCCRAMKIADARLAEKVNEAVARMQAA